MIGVAYRTPEVAREFCWRWRNERCVSRVDVIECTDDPGGSDGSEIDNCRWHIVHNSGYGNALNFGLTLAGKETVTDFDYILIGNVDVFPVTLSPTRVDDHEVPMLKVNEAGRERNPFLTYLQSRFLWTMRPFLLLNRPGLVTAHIAIIKLLGLVPSRPWSCHGSMFCFTKQLLRSCDRPFNRASMLYCEELFYGAALGRAGIRLVPSEMVVEHIGGVSTGPVVQGKRERFFEFWKRSAAEFLGR